MMNIVKSNLALADLLRDAVYMGQVATMDKCYIYAEEVGGVTAHWEWNFKQKQKFFHFVIKSRKVQKVVRKHKGPFTRPKKSNFKIQKVSK